MINKSKSAILFSRNTEEERRSEVKNILEIAKETMNERYLGLPVFVGSSRTKIFEYLKDRVWKRIQGWKEKFLSWAGKEILIKAIAQAIPTFAMECFDITKTLCDQISAMICRYWWNQQEGKHKIHWVNWELMIKPKKEGGLGFRDIHGFNMAMLCKQAWRFLQTPESLCSKVFQAKYFNGKKILDAKVRSGASYAWRSICKGVELLKKGLIWRVGDGESLNIWDDPWLPRDGTRKPITPRGACLLRSVSELMDPVSGWWDVAMVKEFFWEEDAKLIVAIPIHGGMSNVAA